MSSYKECFASDLSHLAEPCVSEKHIIRTTSEVPLFQTPYRRPKHHDEIIESEVEKMKKYGIIRDSKSPWSSQPVLNKKPDNTYRFCIDYKPLNALTVTDKFPIPRIDDIIDNLSGSVYFSNIVRMDTGNRRCMRTQLKKLHLLLRKGILNFCDSHLV